MTFLYMPDEILLIIFNYCDIYTLSQLKYVCKQYCRIAYALLVKKSNYLLVTNQMSKKFRKRCKPLLSSYNSKFMTHYNWKNKIYKKSKICKILDTDLSNKCLQITKNKVWFCDKKYLVAYNRAKDGTIKQNKVIGICNSEIRNVIYCNNVIISSHNDGSIRYWKMKLQDKKNHLQLLKIHSNVHDNTVNNIDATAQHIISSSAGSIKIQKNIREKIGFAGKKEIFNSDNHFVNSISFDPTGTKFAASAVRCFHLDLSLFLIYDLDKKISLRDERDKKDDVCFQILWEDPHTLLMCYKHYIKKMDIRTSEFVRTWNAPFVDSKKYPFSNFSPYNISCFSSDNLYAIMTGTLEGEVILWDQRQSSPIQAYNMTYNTNFTMANSIYSVQFDSTNMYAATVDGLVELDFKGRDHFDHTKIKEIFGNFF